MPAKREHRAAKEAHSRRRRALTKGEGAKPKRWQAVHNIIVPLESEILTCHREPPRGGVAIQGRKNRAVGLSPSSP